MKKEWNPFDPSKFCHCCQPDEHGNPIPDPNCPDCGGEGAVNIDIIDTQPSGEVGDVFERRGMCATKYR